DTEPGRQLGRHPHSLRTRGAIGHAHPRDALPGPPASRRRSQQRDRRGVESFCRQGELMTETKKPEEQPRDATSDVRELPLVALRETVIFPEMIVPLQVGRDKSIQALNKAVADSSPIALVTQRQADREDIGDPSELYGVGTLAKIAQVVQLQDGTVRAIVQGQERLRLLDFVESEPFILA